ncbi:nucleotidyltransferase domain-containing protein [Meiothermus sp. QL-1]|uniref:nucleotidyltransferase domain-containing protein n=1 Tax=Meiothermus sp. QL-1 TaxID=2058095 RepID=UPI000E0CB674|nr:nucleotidyltransferase domain-containing protein [Meiothermus sp. QL-1]RDI95187.1 nucleotidyltransferase domain-containing protein [Meiothermus sp. QL-1]
MVRIFPFDPKARLEELRGAAEALGERPEVLAVVLFGSLAQGQATAMSDADLLVLLESSPLDFSERLLLYRPQGVRGVEVFPYTLEEAHRGLREGWGMVRPALLSGLPLFERKGAWASLRSSLGPA